MGESTLDSAILKIIDIGSNAALKDGQSFLNTARLFDATLRYFAIEKSALKILSFSLHQYFKVIIQNFAHPQFSCIFRKYSQVPFLSSNAAEGSLVRSRFCRTVRLLPMQSSLRTLPVPMPPCCKWPTRRSNQDQHTDGHCGFLCMMPEE